MQLQVYRQNYPQAGFLREPSLDVDSTYIAIKAHLTQVQCA